MWITALSRKMAVCLVLDWGATIEVKLELVGGPIKPDHHPGLPVPEAEGGHVLESVAEGVGVR